MEIRKQLVASRAKTWGPGSKCSSITIHETANTSRGAGAAAHANLQTRGNVREASWHYQVDDVEVVQSFPDEVKCWHAGSSTGAANSIAIEICVNSDGDYDKALANAAALVRHLREKHGLGRDDVVQHNHWTGKNCPTKLRASGRWAAFVASTDPQEDDMALDKGDRDFIRGLIRDPIVTDGDQDVTYATAMRRTLAIVRRLEARHAELDAQVVNLVGAVAALAKGEQFDQAKLLAGIRAAAAQGIAQAIKDGVDIDVVISTKE